MNSLAIDLQSSPADTAKPLNPKLAYAVTAFYVIALLLSAVSGYSLVRKNRLDAILLKGSSTLDELQAQSASMQQMKTALAKQQALAEDVADWLSVTPPTQALFLLLTKDVEPSIAFRALTLDFDQGQPNVRVTLEIATPDAGSATRQISRTQAALDKAGFRQLTIDSDAPTPEGWKFVAVYGLPLHGNFSGIKNLSHN